MKISSDAQAIINNAGAGALEYVQGQGNFGGRLTSGEASRLLTGFSPTITPQQVYSSSNIAQATTAPAPTPNYSDPFALRNYYLNTPDIVAARENQKLIAQDLMKARQTGRAQQQAIQELPQALNVIRGEQAVAGQNQALSETALSENLLSAQSAYDALAREGEAQYGIAEGIRNDLRQLITATKGKAGISYADSYETALQKADKYDKKLQKEADKKAEQAKKDASKEELKKLALSIGISTKGKSSSELRKALEKKAKKDSDLTDQLNQIKLQSAKADIANTYSIMAERGKDKDAKPTVDEGFSTINGRLDSVKGGDGFVNPADYKQAKSDWVLNGLPENTFKTLFGKYINPKESKNYK